MENHHLEWIFPLKIVNFHSHVKLPCFHSDFLFFFPCFQGLGSSLRSCWGEEQLLGRCTQGSQSTLKTAGILWVRWSCSTFFKGFHASWMIYRNDIKWPRIKALSQSQILDLHTILHSSWSANIWISCSGCSTVIAMQSELICVSQSIGKIWQHHWRYKTIADE